MMNLSELKVGDMITAINGYAIEPEPVIEVHPSGKKVRLTDSWGDTQRWLYDDQHEVNWLDEHLYIKAHEGVDAELVLPKDAYGIISDALLLTAERLEKEGHPATNTRAVLTALHRFTTPSVSTTVVVRPRREDDHEDH